ncbi:MAG: DNRLRE domain-containing protein [Anaerolineae bacterium]
MGQLEEPSIVAVLAGGGATTPPLKALEMALQRQQWLSASIRRMGRLTSALTVLTLALFIGLAPVFATRVEPAAPEPTFVLFVPLIEGGCDGGCGAPQTPTPTPPPTVTPIAPAPTPTTRSTATPTPTPSPTPTPLLTPVTMTLLAVADTFIVEGAAGQADANFGTYPGMFLGYDDQAWRRQRALLQFDLAPLPKDAQVVSATLQVYTHNCFLCKPMNVDALRATRVWREEEATWNTSLTLAGEVYGRGVMVAPQRWVSVDVTRLVSSWVGDVPNHGLLLMGREDEPHDWWSIEAREDGAATAPRLVVSYRPP